MNQELVRWTRDPRVSAMPTELRQYARWEYGRNAEYALGALARAGRAKPAKRAEPIRWIARISAAILARFAHAKAVR